MSLYTTDCRDMAAPFRRVDELMGDSVKVMGLAVYPATAFLMASADASGAAMITLTRI
jgi:hypothetical protein